LNDSIDSEQLASLDRRSGERAGRGGQADESRIQERVADAIYEHRLPPGTKLPEADLCRIFGVTRGVVRKVLNRLAAEQLVDLFPNRGAFVARPSVEQTREVYELRRILETGVVRRLASESDRRWIHGVRAQIDEEREAKRSGDTPTYIRLSGKFHLDLAAATANAALEQHLRRVVAQTSLMMALYDVPGTNACSFHEHLEILEAIGRGEFGRAEQLMDDHLKGCERQLRLDVESQPVDLAQMLGAAKAPADRRASAKQPKRRSATDEARNATRKRTSSNSKRRGSKG
jgi:DNA-binding GntR family transcriptional regulator